MLARVEMGRELVTGRGKGVSIVASLKYLAGGLVVATMLHLTVFLIPSLRPAPIADSINAQTTRGTPFVRPPPPSRMFMGTRARKSVASPINKKS